MPAGGSTYAAAVGLDGLLIAPPSQIPGARLAKSAEILQLHGTGFGDTNPHQPAGQLVSVATLVNNVSATVCGQPAAVGFAGLVEVGLDQSNVTLPVLPAGNCPVQLVVDGVGTQSGVVWLCYDFGYTAKHCLTERWLSGRKQRFAKPS